MNVYDFDGTIYDGDSTLDFYFFCLKNNFCLIRYIPKQLFGAVKYLLNRYTKTEFKQCFYCFLNGVEDMDYMLNVFWLKNSSKIKKWYLDQKKSDDIIITASPEFLIQPICTALHLSNLIGSKVDKNTGKYTGINCHGKEKVRRFLELYKKDQIEKFYSDSKCDLPLAKMAKESYLVSKNFYVAWNLKVNCKKQND